MLVLGSRDLRPFGGGGANGVNTMRRQRENINLLSIMLLERWVKYRVCSCVK